MPETLDYARPTPLAEPHVGRFFAALAVGGVIGVPAADLAVSTAFHDEPLSAGGLVFSAICFLVTAAALAIARAAMPRLFGSATLAFLAGLLGPVLGLGAFCLLIL